MVKVLIEFTDGRKKEFYASGSYDSTADGRILYWTEENTDDIISLPVSRISEIIEKIVTVDERNRHG
jgi:hypothetical protein